MIKRMIEGIGKHTTARVAVNGNARVNSSAKATVTAMAATLLLAACASSPDSHFYTLGGAAMTTATDTAATSTAPAPSASPLLIEVMPVNVPSQVSRPQIVTTAGAGQIGIQDYERWSSPLADEISGALSQSLTRSLGAIDVYRTPRPDGSTMYRITVNVQRFESVPGERATIEAVWSVVRSSDSLTLTCRSLANETIGNGYEALAAGHRKALARIAGQIAQGVRAEQASPASAQQAPPTTSPQSSQTQSIRRANSIACPT